MKKSGTLPFFDLYNKTEVETKMLQGKPSKNRLELPKFVFHSLNDALIHSSRDVLIVILRWRETTGNGDLFQSKQRTMYIQNILSINHHVQNVKDEAQNYIRFMAGNSCFESGEQYA